MDKMSRKEQIMAIVSRVRDTRIASGYTQETMADTLGVEKAAYSKYESRSPLPVDLLYTFCELCGVTAEYILAGKQAKRSKAKSQTKASTINLSKKEQDLLAQYKALDRKERAAFEAMLDAFR